MSFQLRGFCRRPARRSDCYGFTLPQKTDDVCVCVPQQRWSLSAVNWHPPRRVSFSAEVAAAVTDVFMRCGFA